ncbi:endospore germination permease [Bacillus ginsengihumi]|uniref:Endospore germination permease n=1 Tax=Heyndrickxia ginsengihumi TaxID=363870 RepID=A0A0A6VAX5_9BACI|nr:endospore germination permease [Heyndrickxia ginsengihumi]KHD84751.1 spore gernimation protein [Heyndrickxia ginsengihumi]NEY20298.1 endospore germination permease [Heyndrickxia ginsengihumi]
MYKISSYQLFVITFIYQLGTTVIFGFGGAAGRDAWIGQLVSMGLGILVLLLYTILMRMNPGLTLVQWFPAQFGRWIGIPIAFLYPLLFLYHVGRGLADIRDMISTTILFNTPFLIIEGVFIIFIAYCVYGGIEIIARLGEMIFPLVLVMFCIQLILLCSTGVMHINNLRPVLENGWSPIWKVVYPGGIMQPFGETIILAMFWTDTDRPEKIMKTTILATILAGLMITCWDMLAISVIGPMFSRFLYPLYTLLGVISIGDFIENLQIFGILYFFMTALIKELVNMLGALKGFQQLTRMKNYRALIIPASVIALFLGMTMSKNISEHVYYTHTKILVPYIWVPIFLIIPTILLIVTWFRQKVFKIKKNG